MNFKAAFYLKLMKVQNISINNILPYEFNNRKHEQNQIDRIAKSISEFGFNQPIVVDEDNIILVGHGRLLAAQKLGLKDVPVLKLTNLNEEQKKAYRILDNKLQNDSTWDFNNLELELGFLEEQGFDLEGWGLDELKDLFPINEPEVTEDDGGGALPGETYIKLGDLIELGKHRVLCGDSTSAEDVEQLLQGIKPEMMFTDPPYGVSYEGGHFHSGNVNIKRKREKLAADESTDIYPDFLGNVLSHIEGACYMWFAGSKGYAVYKALKDANCDIHALIIWHKTNATYAAMYAQYKPRHEPCIYFKPKGSTLRWKGASNECTIWEEKKDGRNDLHPTQKPIVLAARAIKNHDCKTVADFFLGSGSTLIAADQLNRICYGMELEPKYCQVIIERYQKYCSDRNKPFECRINGVEFKGQNDQKNRQTAV
jgi:DNA modification methylase